MEQGRGKETMTSQLHGNSGLDKAGKKKKGVDALEETWRNGFYATPHSQLNIKPAEVSNNTAKTKHFHYLFLMKSDPTSDLQTNWK